MEEPVEEVKFTHSHTTLPGDTPLTIRDASQITGLSERWIRRRIVAGELPASREPLGNIYTWVIKARDLHDWLYRSRRPRGRGSVRARYTLSMPTEYEEQLYEFIKQIPGAKLIRSRSHELV